MKYRNDSSNSETKYARNLIRQKVIPLFEQINPAFKQTMSGNIKHFAETELLLSQKAEELVHRYVKKTKTRITIDLAEIPDEVFNQGLFFEMIRLLGFTASEAVEIIRLRDSQAGKMLNFNNLRILKDRDTIIFEASVENIVNEFSIEYGTRFISEPLVLHLEYQRKNLLRNIPNDKNVACIDIAALQFPLILRKWKRGDRLMPLGMKHEKKLSDFFCDIKLSAFDKENIWLLCSGNKIVWVVGQRIDERYKISEYTRDVLICKL
jgi:tRNA(Ile)-lysidine synthase